MYFNSLVKRSGRFKRPEFRELVALHNLQTSCVTIHCLPTDASVVLFSSGENVLLYSQANHDNNTVLALFMKCWFRFYIGNWPLDVAVVSKFCYSGLFDKAYVSRVSRLDKSLVHEISRSFLSRSTLLKKKGKETFSLQSWSSIV